MTFVIGIDIGGTFTDCVLIDDSGRPTIRKVPSSPPNFQEGVLGGLSALADAVALPLEELLAQAQVFHGCTVGTNALVEDRVAAVGLLLTAGHTETFYTMQAAGRHRAMRPEYIAAPASHYKPRPMVPRTRVREIHERVAFDGTALAVPSEPQVREAVGHLLDAGAEAFAVSLLWSIVNPDHELMVGSIVNEMAPGAFCSLAHQVAPRKGEYERTTATVVNSLVGPEMQHYLDALTSQLHDRGFAGDLGLMSCWGGLTDVASARTHPVLTIGSGPAAGVVASSALDPSSGESLITADMGGTTFDVGVVVDGTPVMRTSSTLGQVNYAVPTVDVRSIGAGGGSIIHYDSGTRTLRVGPRSAAARPGPAAFARGGTEATVTDADIVLGILNPAYFLGGQMQLDVGLAESALERAGAPLGYTAEQTAAAAARIVDTQMADAIRLITIDQGRDPRTFSMVAFGGNGPVHAPALGGALGVKKVIVPLGDLSSGWSAFGVASSDAVLVEELNLQMRSPFDPNAVAKGLATLERRALDRFALQGITDPDRIDLARYAEVKYATQVHQLRVPLTDRPFDEAEAQALIVQFEHDYQALYGQGTGFADAGFALTSLVLRATSKLVEIPDRRSAEMTEGSPKQSGERNVIWYERGADRIPTPIYNAGDLRPGMQFDGPAIAEYALMTLAVRPGQTATVTGTGTIVIEARSTP